MQGLQVQSCTIVTHVEPRWRAAASVWFSRQPNMPQNARITRHEGPMTSGSTDFTVGRIFSILLIIVDSWLLSP